jgi:hypothetical protein
VTYSGAARTDGDVAGQRRGKSATDLDVFLIGSARGPRPSRTQEIRKTEKEKHSNEK